MRFKGLDLNLLAVLDMMIETRSVSRTAERYNVTQPSMSAALGRLRRYFNDDLLIISGGETHVTPKALELQPQLREAINALTGIVDSTVDFEALTSTRTFRIIISDYMIAAVAGPLISTISTTAPHIKVDLLTADQRSRDLMSSGGADLLITPEDYALPKLSTELLFEDSYVVIGWHDNPLLSQPLTDEIFFDATHVGVALGSERIPSFADRHCDAMQRRRNVDVVVSAFTTVPWFLKGTKRLALMQSRLALAMRDYFPIAIAEPPFPVPSMREVVQFHTSRKWDRGLVWLRKELSKMT